MRHIKNTFIYFLVLAFVYIGAGVPLINCCCQQQKEMKMSCCNSHHNDNSCCKTTILKVGNFEKATSLTVNPILNLVAEVLSPYSYQQPLPEIALNNDYGRPPSPDSSRHYLSLYCVLVI
jgi:hypothetical protein